MPINSHAFQWCVCQPAVWVLPVVIKAGSGGIYRTPGPLLLSSETRNSIQVITAGGFKICFSTTVKVLLSALILFVVSHQAFESWTHWQGCQHQFLHVILLIGALCKVVWRRINIEKHCSNSITFSSVSDNIQHFNNRFPALMEILINYRVSNVQYLTSD